MPGEDEDYFPALTQRDNVVVLCDEAHRSQYGLKARINEAGETIYGYAKCLRDALPNATFVAFTGTPVSAKDKDTRAVFGDYVDVYDIEQAVKVYRRNKRMWRLSPGYTAAYAEILDASEGMHTKLFREA